jgi:hypothetical protein
VESNASALDDLESIGGSWLEWAESVCEELDIVGENETETEVIIAPKFEELVLRIAVYPLAPARLLALKIPMPSKAITLSFLFLGKRIF